MRIFKKSALVLAMTAATGLAHAAGEIDIQAAFDAATSYSADVDVVGAASGAVALEALLAGTRQTVDMTDTTNLTAPRSIVYSPNTTIGDNSTLTFVVTNGAVAAGLPAGNPVLIGSDGAAPPAEVIVAAMNDFTTDANGNYTSMRFQVDTAASGDGMGLKPENGYRLAYADGSDVTIITNAGLSAGQSVTIAVTGAADPSATPIVQGTAPAEDVVTVVRGLAATVTPVTSTIDVEQDRLAFLDVPAGPNGPGVPGTDANASQATFTLTTGVAEITFDLTDDTYLLSLARDNQDGVTGANLVIAGGTPVSMTAPTVPGGDYTYDGAGLFASALLAANNDVEIDVDGTTTLQTGNWDLSLVLDTDEVGEVTVLNKQVSHIWDINGAQVKIPYHAHNVAGFNFFLKAVNETATDADVFADVIVENTTQGTRFSLTNVNIGTARANGATTIGQAAIKDAIIAAGGAMNDEDVFHVSMTLTVIAPQDSVHIAAFQSDRVGRTMVPVFVNTNNPNDGRSWQQ